MSKNIHNLKLEEVMDELLLIIEKRGVKSEEVEELKIQYPVYQEDIEKYCATWNELDKIDVPSPSAMMDANFYKMLTKQTVKINAERSSGISLKNIIDKIGSALRDMRTWAVLGALIGAFAIGWYAKPAPSGTIMNNDPITENESPMQFAGLEGVSAFDKIEEIQRTKEANDPNDVVLDMLRRRLIFDESVSVRLSALEVLMKFADHPKVRGYLIESIPHQTEPIVIIELAELMNQLDEKESAKEWKQLLESDWIETDVRLQIEDKLATIL